MGMRETAFRIALAAAGPFIFASGTFTVLGVIALINNQPATSLLLAAIATGVFCLVLLLLASLFEPKS